MKKLRNGIKRFWSREDGLGTLEIIIIIAIIVVIALFFREWIVDAVKGLLDNADTQLDRINTEIE